MGINLRLGCWFHEKNRRITRLWIRSIVDCDVECVGEGGVGFRSTNELIGDGEMDEKVM
jgi:hypothetical protein